MGRKRTKRKEKIRMKVKDKLRAIKSTLSSIFYVDHQAQLDNQETHTTQKDD